MSLRGRATPGPLSQKLLATLFRKESPLAQTVRYDFSLLSDDDLYLFNEGSHFRLYYKLGAHPLTVNDTAGTYFAVWAPDAEKVFVIGDFNDWDKASHPLAPRGQSGIWDGFIPGVGPGTLLQIPRPFPLSAATRWINPTSLAFP